MTRHLRPTSVFLSYAHEDEWLLKELVKHLSLLKRQGLISAWYDQQIVPGTDRIKAIEQQLEQAAIILLLVSIDFLASDYYYQIEMEHALKRHKAGETRVIPIIVRPTNWKETPLANLHVLPTNGKAISIWRNRDSAFVNVEKGIRHAIKDLSSSSLSVLHNNKGYENGNKPPVNWTIPKFSTKSYISIFLIILILTFSASFFYVLCIVPDSGRTLPSNIIPSSARTASSPIATKQPTPRYTYLHIYPASPTTPLMIPCVDNCVPGFNVAVILERVDFDNSANDGVVVTFQFTTEKANVCSIDVDVLKIEPPKLTNDDNTISDIQGHIFSIGSLDTGQTELKANFSFMPDDNIHYQLSLVLSCQTNNPMFYQKITLVFKNTTSAPFNITAGSPIAIFVISPLEVLIAFVIIIFAFTTIRWLAQSSPFGVLTKPKVAGRRRLEEEKETLSIILGAERSLQCKLISKSTISCEELELASKGHFNFYGGKFDLVFKRSRQVYIRVRRDYASSIGLRRHGEIRMVSIDHHRQERLLDGDIINIGGEDIVVFSVSNSALF